MVEAGFPINEKKRLLSLHALNVLNTPLEARYERITRVVCRALNVPIAAITLIDESRQWFKSIQGATVVESPRETSFCAHAILNDGMMVVEDTTKDARFSDNPFVTGGPQIRFYAGQPLSLAPQIRLGTLCAMDTKPRHLSINDTNILRDLARMVVSCPPIIGPDLAS